MAEATGAKFLSQADFARRRGVSRKTVTGWKQKTILVLNEAGLIDVEATEWALDQRPASYRGGVTHRPVRVVTGNRSAPEPKAPAKPKPDTWQTIGEVMPRPGAVPTEGADDGLELDPTNLPLSEAVRRKENFLGLQRKQEVEKNDRKLVDREAAEKLFFDTARDVRDAWLSWPARVAIPMADELKVDPRALTAILNAYVKQHLSELGDPEADFG
ncbi:hypothetical protein [Methylobacterium sp. Leaf117]|uniref:hypothetical protein n=1 Tax=Methylobacterium sp. Leaf117 TaxID=1736260 RepID=UPI0006F9FC56|nr:hypothetical protein [Methylobacterium sp. Leaf117]KQP82870.1 hypothetical protein ASF57_12095 [Methylobacterium sp. Leaf117]